MRDWSGCGSEKGVCYAFSCARARNRAVCPWERSSSACAGSDGQTSGDLPCFHGLPVTCPALMSPADPVGYARFGALTRRALRNRYSLVGPSARHCSGRVAVARQRRVSASWRYLLSFAHWAGSGHLRSCIGMSVLTKMPNYVRPFAYKQLAWISFFHGAPTFRCSLFRGARAGVLWQNQQCPNYVSSWQKSGYVSGADLHRRVDSHGLMQGAAFAVCSLPHRGVIWPALISGLLELPLQVVSPNPTGPWRFSMRVQITPRCGLVLGSTRASGS